MDRLVKQVEGMAYDSKGGVAHVDVDQAALRVTLDVIGMVRPHDCCAHRKARLTFPLPCQL